MNLAGESRFDFPIMVLNLLTDRNDSLLDWVAFPGDNHNLKREYLTNDNNPQSNAYAEDNILR